MTKPSKLIENLISVLDQDTNHTLCDYISDPNPNEQLNDGEMSESLYCKGIACHECMFNAGRSEFTKQALLKLSKMMDLIDVDS